MLLNYTWWANRKDSRQRNIFQGGFLGLDNISVFDRNLALPDGVHLEQADGTAWMAMYSLNLMRMAAELAQHDSAYEDLAIKFVENFIGIGWAINNPGGRLLGPGLWDEEDEFYYDKLSTDDGRMMRLKVRSMVGLVPLFAVETLEPGMFGRLKGFERRLDSLRQVRPDLTAHVSRWFEPGQGGRRLLSLMRGDRMKSVLRRMLDETEFLSDYGVRALSQGHRDNPYIATLRGEQHTVNYWPGESQSDLFGGNSNWRGPVWFPVNFLVIDALQKFHNYYGDDFKIECPTGSGNHMTLLEVARRANTPAEPYLPARRPGAACGFRRRQEATDRSALPRLSALLRVLPRRHGPRRRRFAPNGLDRPHRHTNPTSEGEPMKAITVEPKKPGTARLEDIAEPDVREGSVLVEAIAVGVCGTDVEIVEGKYGWAPPAKTRLVLGHESLGRVVDPGPSGGLKEGDLVVGIVRRPDPIPCPSCVVGEWDMCRNGQYTERGIKQINGFMSERWRVEPEYVMKVDSSLGLLGVLLEPTTVVAKAWEQVVAVGQRAFWDPRTVLVTGAGPIGLLAALVGKQRGLEVHVLDRAESGPKPDLVRALGATYHSGKATDIGFQPDIVVECTGVGQVISDSLWAVVAGGVVCLTGVGTGGATAKLATADAAAEMVLRNTVIVGSVNANKRHWYKAGEVLARADRSWLARLVTRRERPEDFETRTAADAGRHQGRCSIFRGVISRVALSEAGVKIAIMHPGSSETSKIALSVQAFLNCSTNGRVRSGVPVSP